MARAPMLTVRERMGASSKYEPDGQLGVQSIHPEQRSAPRGQGGTRGPGDSKDASHRADDRQLPVDRRKVLSDSAGKGSWTGARAGNERGQRKRATLTAGGGLQGHGLGRRAKVSPAMQAELSAGVS